MFSFIDSWSASRHALISSFEWDTPATTPKFVTDMVHEDPKRRSYNKRAISAMFCDMWRVCVFPPHHPRTILCDIIHVILYDVGNSADKGVMKWCDKGAFS